MVTVEKPEELTRSAFRGWLDRYDCERCVIEYNGMWMLDDLYQALPELWMVYQEFFLRRCAQHFKLQRQYAKPRL